MDETQSPPQDDAILVLSSHTSETLAVACSPNNRNLVISGGMDDAGFLWDLELGAQLAKVDGAGDSVSTVAISCDGKYAAFGSENGAISIVYLDGSAAPSVPLEGPGDIISFLAWHPRGPVLLAGSEDRMAYMWNVTQGTFMQAFIGHEDGITCGGFTSDGKLVVTGAKDSSVRVWNPSTGETITRIQVGVNGLKGIFHNADIICMAMGNGTTEKLVASGCAAGDVFLTHRESGQVVHRLSQHGDGVESLSFSPADAVPGMLASTGGDGVIRVWDVEKSCERCKFEHGGVIAKIAWHPSKPFLASGSSDGTVALWNVLEGVEVRRFWGHESFISDLCWAADASFIATTSGDSTVRIFDVRQLVNNV